jgi:molecular chaperone GrpE
MEGKKKMMPQPEAEQPEAGHTETEHVKSEPKSHKLKEELEKAKAEAEEYLAGWKRAQADFINFKRRSEQEKEDTVKYCTTNFILKILPVLDDFERAEALIPPEQTNACVLDGMKMVERKLRSFLEGQGVSVIKALGEPFDPYMHEAVTQADGEEGIVVNEFEKGYKLYDRVIRASKVAVGTGKQAKEKEE